LKFVVRNVLQIEGIQKVPDDPDDQNMHFEVVILINLAIKNLRKVSEGIEDVVLFAS
jgi:hypothetical protein